MTETSTKPYFIRALHEWCTDNGYTPYVAVVVDEHTVVPREHVQDGQITLNIGTLATNKLVMGNDYIEFQARFGGVSRQISVPIGAIRAIYARETGQGMAFEPATTDDAMAADGQDSPEVPGTEAAATPAETADERPALTAVPTPAAPNPDDDGPDEPPPSSPDTGSRPRLKVIK